MPNRREAIKDSGVVAAKGAGAYIGGSLVLKLARANNNGLPYRVETENADFHLFHGFHGEGRLGNSVSPTQADANLDGFFLETGAFPYLLPDGKITIDGLRDTKFYKDVIPFLEKNNIPMLLGDIPISKARASAYFLTHNALEIGAVIGGAKMAFPSEVAEEKMSRREMLQRTAVDALKRTAGGALLGWGGFGLMRYPAIADEGLYRQPWAENIRDGVGFGEFMHPEDFLVGFRNAMIAEKLLFYTQTLRGEGVERPRIGVAIGGAHALISQYLKEGRDYSTDFLSRYPDTILKTAFGEQYNLFLPTLIEIQESNGTKTARKLIDPELARDTINIEGNKPSGESKG